MRRGAAALAALSLAWLACGRTDATGEAPLYRAPAEARAAWVLEPPVIAAGDVATLDLAVVAAPDAVLRPFELPSGVDGFFVLDREPLSVVKEPARWIHHRRLRLRAVEVGRFTVPGGSVELASSDGRTTVLHYDPLPIEVVSVLGGVDRQSPYGIRLLAGRRGDGAGTLGAFAAGVVLTLLSVAMLLLVRRRLARAADAVVSPPHEPPAWEIARSELAAARAGADEDPRGALDRASLVLRRYAVRRFGGDANVRCTDELRGSSPPFTLTTRWERFVALLAALDAERFPPPVATRAERSDRARALLSQVEGFVDETAPREPSA